MTTTLTHSTRATETPLATGTLCGGSHPCLVDLIAGHPFATAMPRRIVERIADFATEAEFPAGDLVFHEGDPANRFYLILKGRVVLESHVGEDGVVPVQTLGPGEVLGWSWLFPPYYWHFDARAVEPTRAVFLYGTPLRELCEEDPQLGYEIYKRIANLVVERLQATRRNDLRPESFNPPVPGAARPLRESPKGI